MLHNRIARFSSQVSRFPIPSGNAMGSQPIVAQIAPYMVMVPVASQNANWQAQLYRLAHAQAVAEQRHMRRFFSVWN